MAIFDFRIRPPYKGFLDMIMYAQPERRDGFTRNLKFEPSPAAREQSIDTMLGEMDAGGVERGLVVGRTSGVMGSVTNGEVAEFVSLHPDRFVGAGSLDLTDRRRAMAGIDEAVDLGLGILNIEPGAAATPMHTDDRRLYPIYGACEDRDLPVIIMCGGNAGPDLRYTQPHRIDRVLADFPDLRVVASHGNWPWVSEILHVAFRRPNLYLSPDMYLPNMPGMDDYVRAADGFLADRFLYGSSFPFCGIQQYADWFRGLPINPDSMAKVTWQNAMRLLGLDDPDSGDAT
jgi:predicted TIM-barrel fold metal-dependent hydrolase